jgi:CheY-like chemotaxis protein
MPARILIIEDNEANLELMSYLDESPDAVIATSSEGKALYSSKGPICGRL